MGCYSNVPNIEKLEIPRDLKDKIETATRHFERGPFQNICHSASKPMPQVEIVTLYMHENESGMERVVYKKNSSKEEFLVTYKDGRIEDGSFMKETVEKIKDHQDRLSTKMKNTFKRK